VPCVYGVTLDLFCRVDSDPRDAFLDAVRAWLVHRAPSGLDRLGLGEAAELTLTDGARFRWDPFGDAERFLVEFTLRARDAEVADVSWLTQGSLFTNDDALQFQLSIRNDGPEGHEPGARLAERPTFLPHLLLRFDADQFRLPCRPEANQIAEDEMENFARYVLLDPRREYPVLFLSPNADGTFVVPPDVSAWEFQSLAKVHCTSEPGATFVLTETLRRRELSCYHGALRLYWPGLSSDSDPLDHPLVFPTRLVRETERRKLGRWLAYVGGQRFREEVRLLELRHDRGVRRERTKRDLARQLEALRGTAARAEEWRTLAEEYSREAEELRRERDDLVMRLQVAEQEVRTLRYARGAAPATATAPAVPAPTFETRGGTNFDSVEAAVQAATEQFGDALLVLPSARESARESPFRRPDEVFRSLRSLAEVARARRAGPLGRSLRDALLERGCDYRSGLSETTSRKLLRQYEFGAAGRSYLCEEHLCLGGSSYDPAECLRIYLTTRHDDEPRFIIGHVGRHLDVVSTT
jgi:hypothetical protein